MTLKRRKSLLPIFFVRPRHRPVSRSAGFVAEAAMPAALPSRFQPLDFNHTQLNGRLLDQPRHRRQCSRIVLFTGILRYARGW